MCRFFSPGYCILNKGLKFGVDRFIPANDCIVLLDDLCRIILVNFAMSNQVRAMVQPSVIGLSPIHVDTCTLQLGRKVHVGQR